jgi:CubicO group peptidase (beta-lactamase class C family)
MTERKSDRGKDARATGSGRWLRWLAGAALLAVIPLACEVPRWHALPDPLPAASESGPESGGESASRAGAAVATWLSETPVTGLAACVAAAGRLLWCSASGLADMDTSEPLTARSSMRLGSVSKPVTSVLLARVVERGLLDLERPIGAIMPELPEHLRVVTARQLASHTAGVRHYAWRFGWPPHETWSRVAWGSVTDSIAAFAGDPLLFAPGTAFRYSSHGYTLLGAVLERAGGAGFGELLQREIVAPLGLEATALDSPRAEPGWASSYEVLAGRYRGAFAVDNSRGWPGAGIRSSAGDLSKLASVLPGGDLIRRDTVERLLTPQSLADGRENPQGYALGWRLARTRQFLGGGESYRVAHHGGVSAGSSAFLLLFPDQAVAVAVLVNTRTGSGPLADLAFEIAEPFMAGLLGPPGSGHKR